MNYEYNGFELKLLMYNVLTTLTWNSKVTLGNITKHVEAFSVVVRLEVS